MDVDTEEFRSYCPEVTFVPQSNMEPIAPQVPIRAEASAQDGDSLPVSGASPEDKPMPHTLSRDRVPPETKTDHNVTGPVVKASAKPSVNAPNEQRPMARASSARDKNARRESSIKADAASSTSTNAPIEPKRKVDPPSQSVRYVDMMDIDTDYPYETSRDEAASILFELFRNAPTAQQDPAGTPGETRTVASTKPRSINDADLKDLSKTEPPAIADIEPKSNDQAQPSRDEDDMDIDPVIPSQIFSEIVSAVPVIQPQLSMPPVVELTGVFVQGVAATRRNGSGNSNRARNGTGARNSRRGKR